MDIFHNQCSESLGFDSMLAANPINSPLQGSEPTSHLNFNSSPFFSTIVGPSCTVANVVTQPSSLGSCSTSNGSCNVVTGSSTGPNDVLLPSIFVKVPMQINQQYQQQSQSRSNNAAEGIKCEDKSEPIKRELGDLRALEKGTAMVQLPSISESYLEEDRQEQQQQHVEEAELRVHCCEFCPLVTLVEQTLRDHVHAQHPSRERAADGQYFNCPACENKFWQRNSLEVHLEVDHMMVQSELRTLVDRRWPRAQQETTGCENSVNVPIVVPVSEPPLQTVAPENRSRIYIKNVQLLKKPDVIEQENVQQAQHQHHNQQQQSIQQQAPQNGKIYIRNVSLLQNLNFAQNVENVFQNSSGLHESKYSFVVPAPSPNSQSPPISIGEQPGVNGGTSQRNKIFIRNVDILRNPMIPITPPTIMSTCEMSRTSSSESLYTTPPPPVVSPATSVSSIGTPSSMGFSGPNMVILPTPICSSNSSTPPMIYTPPSMTVANNFDAAQQPPRKSKIFIKNISVLKQPTIHLKSVDELNLMTIDQVQLQNLLPPTTSSVQSLNSTEEMSADDGQQPSMQEENFGNILEEVPSDLDDNFQDNDGAQYQDMAGCDSACGSVTEQESYQQEFNNDFIIIEPDRSSENIAYEEQQGHMRIPDHSNELMDHQQIQPSAPEPSETHQFHHTDDYNMFVCAEDIINLDPPAPSEPESSEPPSIQSTPPHTPSQPQQPLQAHPGRIYVADNLMEPSVANMQTSPQLQVHPVNETSISPLNQIEQINNGIPAGQSADPLLQQTSCPKAQPNKPLVKEQERTRSRGRPKGAKQTGITKLKKLYTNLTPMEEGYKCDIMSCGVRFRQRETLEYHKTCHDLSCDIPNTTGTRCPECGAQDFRTWNTLHTHLWRDHSIDMELYSCQLCNFKTPVLCRLNNTHMKIHSDEKNFICAVCNKAFKNNKQLRNHRRTHREPADVQQVKEQRSPSPWLHSDYPVRCVKCDFKFANHKYLKAHMENRHGTSEVDGRIKCTVCGMLFKTRYTLQTHMAKHSDEKRFKCSSCDFSCNDHNSMRRHKMRHDSEGHMYRCAYCDYTSIQSTTYRRHLERMHADVAPKLLYKCSECAFVSISETKYQLHWLKHKPVETEKTTTAVVVPEGTTPPTAAAASTEPSQQVVEVEEPERQCESVNSDVVIVEKDSSEPPMDAFSLIPSPAGDQQFPLIRPAGFANNLSKVDNFYGYGGDQQQQSAAGMQSSVQQGSTVQQVMPMTTTTTATTDGNAIMSATCVSTVGGTSSGSGHQQQHGYDSLMNSMNSMVPMTYGESALGS
nr:uncharacterized protein LOC109418057 isoform X1 [Aedes albopictus]XP_029726649.1 uncharacterized protein LOC109418057 isoform X2 [Aedes albopictus]